MFNLSTGYVVDFDIASIILTVMLLFTLFMRRTFPTVAIKQYRRLLFCNIISSVADLISAYTICNPEIVSRPLNYAISIAFLLSHNITGVLFMMYIISAIRKNLGTKPERIMWMSFISIITVLTLTTPFTKAIFYFDSDNIYTHGPLLSVFYIITAISIIYSVFMIVKYRATMSSFQIGTNIAFILLIALSVIFQRMFPNYLIENFIIATACIMMNVALDNPATYFYKSASCYNQSAFNALIGSRLKGKSEFVLVGFEFDDISVIKNRLSEEEYGEMVFEAIRRGQKVAGRRNMFILKDETFVIFHEKESSEKLIDAIEASLKIPFKFTTGNELSAVPHFVLLRFPGEAKTVNDVNIVIQNTLTHIYRKTGEHIIGDSTKLLDDIRREEKVVYVLREAIRNNGMTVLFQPIYNQKEKRFSCAEALVRLRDNPENIYPDEFIPIAEKNGLILDIGEAVLEHVCRFISESDCRDYGIEKINVNLSMLQLVNKTEVERLVEICRRYEISPNSIVFEMTETATEGDGAEAVLQNINMLKKEGFSLSLDDYGTGYSNINNLIKFPIDQVKVDKDLLWSAVKSREYMSVLENVILIIRNFGCNCVVEGVEDDSMEDILTKLKVEYFQGYKYSKPISAISLIKFLKDNNG